VSHLKPIDSISFLAGVGTIYERVLRITASNFCASGMLVISVLSSGPTLAV